MRVLWFCNTPAASDEAVGSNGTGGWLKSLDKELQKSVDLHIAFYSKTKTEPFRYGLTTYYPIPIKKRSNINKFIDQYKPHTIDEEDLPIYLKIINQVHPDIIHVHGTEMPFACITKHTSIPVVISIQGNLTVYHHKFFSGISKEYLRTRDFGSFKSSLTRGFVNNYNWFASGSKIEQKNLAGAKNIIGRTDWDRRISSILAYGSHYYHVDEILRDSFYSNEWHDSLSPSRPIIVHTTNGDNYYKGFETICYALHLLNEMGLNVEWRVAGISNGSLINVIVKRQLKDKYPSKGLVLMGNLDECQLVNKLLESDMYVMTSHIENSPNNLCEAMILGVPCISTFAGGSGSLLEDHKEGILIQDGDPWSMAGAILELAKDRKTAIDYGKNARSVALKRHCKERVVSCLVEAYNNIIFQA